MKTAILVPVKAFSRAKLRMSPFLSRVERAELARVMFEDVSAALENASVPVVIVTDSEEAAGAAKSRGWRVLMETDPVSETASVDAASARLAQEGYASALRIPADIPLIVSHDVEDLYRAAAAPPAAVLVPSHDGTGTNALLRCPPDLFASRFGPGSLALHLGEAFRVRAQVAVVRNDRLALDLDDARDVRLFLQKRSRTRTEAFLKSINVEERIAHAGQPDISPGH